jgi:diguanylate cyclase (GGDEF)-like protein
MSENSCVHSPPPQDAAAVESAPLLASLRRTIVGLGVGSSVGFVTLAAIVLSLTLSSSLRWLAGSPIDAVGLAVAAIVPLCLAPPLTWGVMQLVVRLDRSERLQQYLATHDPLTGLCNRREFFLRVHRVHEHARRSGDPGWLMMLDLDRFKLINDDLGHLAGDRAIRHVADLCRAETRPGDVLGRYGGDELALLIVGVDRDAALSVAERLRARIAGEALVLADGRSVSVTASIGLAPLDRQAETLDRTLARADEALRDAKRLGRDGICVSEAEGRMLPA